MSEFDYKRYLASREWAKKKMAVRKRDKDVCERCHVRPHQSTHHLTYANVGNEPLEDLLGVCDPCHEYLSAKRDSDPADEVMAFIVAVAAEEGRSLPLWKAVHKAGGVVIGGILPNGSPDYLKPWAEQKFRRYSGEVSEAMLYCA